MKFLPLLRVRTIRAADATAPLLRELWELRRELIDVQPGVALDDDYASFCSFFAGPDARISLIVSRAGRIEGFLGWHVRALRVAGRRHAIIDSDYFFVRVALRGHVVMTALALHCFAGALLHAQALRLSIAGHGYPASVLSGARFASRVCFPGDPGLADWERAAMAHFVSRFCGASYDPERGLVRMRTLPHPPPRRSRSPALRSLLARFESYNPRWSEGYGLPYLIHIDLGSIAAGGLHFLRRD